MENKITAAEMARCLRCCSPPKKTDCLGEKCRYFSRATDEEIMDFCHRTDSQPGDYPGDFFDGCDVDRMGQEAAEMIEAMAAKRGDLISRAELFNRLSGCRDKAEIFAVIQGMEAVG